LEEFMRKILALGIVIAMIFALAIPASALAATANNASPTIDGVRDDVYAGPFPIAGIYAGNEGTNNMNPATGNVWLAWDASALYFYIEIYDTTPNHESAVDEDWAVDNIEIYIDWTNAKGTGGVDFTDRDTYEVGVEDGNVYYQVRIPANMTSIDDFTGAHWYDFGWGGVTWGNDDGVFDSFAFNVGGLNGSYANGYVIEIKVDAPIALSEGQVIPFDISIGDNITGETREGQVYMSADNPANDMQWASPGAIGAVMTLGGAPAADAGDDAAGGGEEADATTPLPRPTPRTGDAGVMALIALMAIAAAGIVVIRRKAVK
jgi:hypothetical protein